MIKILSFLLVLIPLIPNDNNLSNNQVDIKSSEENILYSSTKYHNIIGTDGENTFVLKNQQGRYMIERLDKDLNHVNEEFIKEWQNKKSYNLESIVYFHKKLYAFFSRRGLTNNVLYVQTIDKETLLQNEDLTPITDIKNIKGNWADFHFSLSKKENKLLVVSRIKLHLKKTQFNEFYVFDKDMELQWQKKDIYQFERQGPRDNIYLVDEFGNASILSLIKRATILDISRPIKNIYSIYRYSNNGENFNEYVIALDDLYIRGLNIVAGNDGSLICAGFYSDRFPYGVAGTFFYKIDANSDKMRFPQLKAFDDRFLQQLAELPHYKETLIGDEELISFKVTDLVMRSNGNIVMIGEQYLEQNYNTFNNLLVMNFSPYGDLLWNNIIMKRQDYNVSYLKQAEHLEYLGEYVYEVEDYNFTAPMERNFCSYALVAPVDGDKIAIVFNDHIKNLSEESNKPKNFANPKKSYLAAVEIDQSGHMEQYPILESKRKSLHPQPLAYYDTKTNQIYLPAYRSRKYKFLKLTFSL